MKNISVLGNKTTILYTFLMVWNKLLMAGLGLRFLLLFFHGYVGDLVCQCVLRKSHSFISFSLRILMTLPDYKRVIAPQHDFRAKSAFVLDANSTL